MRGYAHDPAQRPRFVRLTLAGALNFGALFLYITSAPAFVLDILQPRASSSFGWFFAPTIGGMMLGAFVSAGARRGASSGQRLANIGFACCGVARPTTSPTT